MYICIYMYTYICTYMYKTIHICMYMKIYVVAVDVHDVTCNGMDDGFRC